MWKVREKGEACEENRGKNFVKENIAKVGRKKRGEWNVGKYEGKGEECDEIEGK